MGPNLPNIQYVLGALSPREKRPGRKADYAPSTSAEVKKNGTIIPLPYTPSWRGV
jgi:hypothetical protein